MPETPPQGDVQEPPQLAPLNVEEQRLYSESLLDIQATHPISKAEPSQPAEEAHFGCLYSRSHSFGLHPELMTIGESLDQFDL